MKKDIIVYFHGYGSNSNTDKVARLQKGNPDALVIAFDIHVNPEISLPYLNEKIDHLFVDFLHTKGKVIFVGTSLGGWYASLMGRLYNVPCVIINPCYDPQESLVKYGISKDILDTYFPMSWDDSFKYFIATDDEVIDFASVNKFLENLDVTYTLGGHRYNGKEFDAVIEYIKKLLVE